MKGDTNMSTEVKKAAKAPEAKKPEVKEVKKVSIDPIVAKLPETFTPALLDKLFNLNDGGKTVRRHLRKNFAEPLEHAHKDKWTFSKTQTDVLQYFADRYAYDLKVLEPVKTA